MINNIQQHIHVTTFLILSNAHIMKEVALPARREEWR